MSKLSREDDSDTNDKLVLVEQGMQSTNDDEYSHPSVPVDADVDDLQD